MVFILSAKVWPLGRLAVVAPASWRLPPGFPPAPFAFSCEASMRSISFVMALLSCVALSAIAQEKKDAAKKDAPAKATEPAKKAEPKKAEPAKTPEPAKKAEPTKTPEPKPAAKAEPVSFTKQIAPIFLKKCAA